MVDILNLRLSAAGARISGEAVLLLPDEVEEIIDELKSLRVQLAEARRNAVPWRDGPARGGEMPERYRQISARHEIDDGIGVSQGRFYTLIGDSYLVTEHRYVPASKIHQWFYIEDLLPANAEETGVSNG